MTKNSLQAVLNQKMNHDAKSKDEGETPKTKKEREKRGHRANSRIGKVVISGHFDKEISKQLKLIAIEEDKNIQELLGEALDLLFVKKGKNVIR